MTFCGKTSFRSGSVKLSQVHLLILSLLKRKPAHGYMIMQGLRENLDGLTLKSGTVYPALHRLVSLGLIIGEEVEQTDRPDAIEYKLTDKGKEILKKALHGLSSEFKIQDSFWRFLGATAPRDVRKSLLRWTMQERSPMGLVFMKRMCSGPHASSTPIHQDFLKKYREYLQEELEWIDSQLSELKSSKKKR